MTTCARFYGTDTPGSFGRKHTITHNHVEYMTLSAGAKHIGRTAATLSKWIAEGFLSTYTINTPKMKWVKVEDLQEALQEAEARKHETKYPVTPEQRATMLSSALTTREAALITGRSIWAVNRIRRIAREQAAA